MFFVLVAIPSSIAQLRLLPGELKIDALGDALMQFNNINKTVGYDISFYQQQGFVISETNVGARFTIEEGGNVGIGLLNPESLFHVAGSAEINGKLSLLFGDDNVIVGENAGNALNGGSDNTFVGEKAGNLTTTGSDNVFLGNDAGRFNTTGSGNVFLGGDAGQNSTTATGNIAIGRAALLQTTTETGLVAIGDSALFNNKEGVLFDDPELGPIIGGGNQNTAIGTKALYANTAGASNTAVGWKAMEANTKGYSNTAIGDIALRNNTEGINNTGIGYAALFTNSTGNFNNALGAYSLGNNQTGSGNTAVGDDAMRLNTSGRVNTAVGLEALRGNTTGEDNVALGFSAFSTGSAYSNSTGLGHDAEPGASNTIRLGNNAVTTIGGTVDFTVTSDARFKTEVQEDVPGIAFIESLRPVTYHLDWQAMDDWRAEHLGERDSSDYAEKRDIETIKFTGFLAQEVEAAARDMGYDFSGVDAPDTDQQAYGLRYATFVVPLVKATQEQQTEIRDLKSEVGDRKSEMEDLRSEIRDQKLVNERLQNELDELRFIMEQILATQPQDETPVILNQSPSLQQNQPNPTNGMTRVSYFLPEGKSGELIITAIDGKELQRITLSQKGKGQMDLQTRNLPSGTYNYSLVVDGQVIDTKRMVLQK